MKKLLLSALSGLLALGAFTSCEEKTEPTKAIELTGGQTTQSVFADQEQTSGGLSFTTNGPWTSTISESTRAASWISIDPSSGSKAGDYTITISLEPNYTGADRTATITIVCGEQTIPITVTQKATTEDGVVPEPEVDVLTLIPDPVFLAYCKEQMTTWDTNGDSKLSKAEAATVTDISIKRARVASMAGIEYFIGLETLDCSGNHLTLLDVSKNTDLTALQCQRNRLTSLNVSGCTALIRLTCIENELTSLDVSGFTALQILECWSNPLTSLDVSECTALTSLDCHSLQLVSLNASGCTALTDLDCSDNHLTSLDVSKNTALTMLHCRTNQLVSLDVSKNIALEYLGCSYNLGDGVSKFPVKAWFDNSSIPTGRAPSGNTYVFTTSSWYSGGKTIIPHYYTE
jgi:hypothetical protein